MKVMSKRHSRFDEKPDFLQEEIGDGKPKKSRFSCASEPVVPDSCERGMIGVNQSSLVVIGPETEENGDADIAPVRPTASLDDAAFAAKLRRAFEENVEYVRCLDEGRTYRRCADAFFSQATEGAYQAYAQLERSFNEESQQPTSAEERHTASQATVSTTSTISRWNSSNHESSTSTSSSRRWESSSEGTRDSRRRALIVTGFPTTGVHQWSEEDLYLAINPNNEDIIQQLKVLRHRNGDLVKEALLVFGSPSQAAAALSRVHGVPRPDGVVLRASLREVKSGALSGDTASHCEEQAASRVAAREQESRTKEREHQARVRASVQSTEDFLASLL